MEANVLDCGRFQGEGGCNDNTDGFGPIVQKRAAGVGQVGGRSTGTEDPRKMDRRFGVKMGVMEGGLFPIIKNSKRKVWLEPLFDRAYAAFHGVLNGSWETVTLPKPISQH